MGEDTKTFEYTVNDGKGLFDTKGLIDTLIVDCEELVKCVISGQGISFCAKAVEMVQKLSNLKRGVKNDMDDLRRQIRESNQRGDMLQERVNELEHALVPLVDEQMEVGNDAGMPQ